MVFVTKYSMNCYIVKDPNNIVQEKMFNIIFNKILVSRNEIKEGDGEISRVKRYGDYLFVDGYGSLVQNDLGKLVYAFLDNVPVKRQDFVLSDSEKMVLKQYLPIISKRKGDQCGGTRNDTSYLDPNVAPLCEAFSSFKGIKTFSSCEGHPEYNGQTNFYILFTADELSNLDVLTKILWQGLEIVYDKYKQVPYIQLMFDYGHWESIRKTYYEIRIPYRANQQGLVFESMKFLADYLKGEQE